MRNTTVTEVNGFVPNVNKALEIGQSINWHSKRFPNAVSLAKVAQTSYCI
jgi:hypothetical protein